MELSAANSHRCVNYLFIPPSAAEKVIYYTALAKLQRSLL